MKIPFSIRVSRAFTLTEVLIVIVTFVLLAAFSLPLMQGKARASTLTLK